MVVSPPRCDDTFPHCAQIPSSGANSRLNCSDSQRGEGDNWIPQESLKLVFLGQKTLLHESMNLACLLNRVHVFVLHYSI